MLKKLSALFTLGLSLVLVACSGKSADTAKETTQWDKIEQAGVIKVATPGTYWPTSFHDDKDGLTGYEIELLNEIAKRLGVKAEYQELAFAESFASLDNGSVDLFVNNLDSTPEREEKYNLSVPYKYSVSGMIVRADGSSGIEKADLSDWKGKKAAGEAGTNFMKLAEKLGAELVTYDNVSGDVYLRDVENGRTDFIPNDYYTQALYVEMMKEQFPNLAMGKAKYNPTKQAMVMNKADNSLKQKIDPIIEEMIADGTLKALSEKYYSGADLTKPEEGADKLPVVDFSK